MLPFSTNRPSVYLPASSPLPTLKPQAHSRRAIGLAGTILVARWIAPGVVWAKEMTVDKEYESLARDLIGGIRGVIELELSGAEERAVRV